MKNMIKNSLLVGTLVLMSSGIASADTWTHPSYATESALRNSNVQQHLVNTTRSEKHDTRSNINQNLSDSSKDHLKAQENVRLHSIYNSH